MERYGRPITGDRYVAMKHGPVPGATYDVLKALEREAYVPVHLPDGAETALAAENCTVRGLRRPNLDLLSKSECDCLLEAAVTNGRRSFERLTQRTHDEAWDAADDDEIIELEKFLLTLKSRNELRAHFLHDDP